VGTDEPGDYSSAAGLGVFRSDDAGESWIRITSDPALRCASAAAIWPAVRVDPSNPDVVYTAGIVNMKVQRWRQDLAVTARRTGR